MSSPIEAGAPVRPRAAARAARQARLARLLSWLAAAIGLGFLVVFLVQAGLFSLLAPESAVVQPQIANPDEISASGSTVSGIDRDSLPYEVTAARGHQDKDKPNIVHLEELAATFRSAQGAIYAMTSKAGIYDTKVKDLQMSGDVVIRQGNRFTARMDKARVVVDGKSLTSNVPVDVDFGNGTVHANGLEITNDGARILFLNGVKARFGAATAKGDQNP